MQYLQHKHLETNISEETKNIRSAKNDLNPGVNLHEKRRVLQFIWEHLSSGSVYHRRLEWTFIQG